MGGAEIACEGVRLQCCPPSQSPYLLSLISFSIIINQSILVLLKPVSDSAESARTLISPEFISIIFAKQQFHHWGGWIGMKSDPPPPPGVTLEDSDQPVEKNGGRATLLAAGKPVSIRFSSVWLILPAGREQKSFIDL